jgi:hypothetical protein
VVTTASPGRRRSARTVLVLSACALALLLAFVSLLVSWRALDQAGDARDIAAAAGRGQPMTPAAAQREATSTPEPARSTATSEATTPSAVTSGEPPPLNPRTAFKIKYDKQSLTLKPQGSYPMYVDLDEPRANVGQSGYDLALAGPSSYSQDPAYFKLGEDVAGSEAGAPGMTPQDCGEKIRTAPVGAANIPARKGTVLCLTTSYTAARERGDVQRLVLLEVTGVATDNTVTVQVSAWDIPR